MKIKDKPKKEIQKDKKIILWEVNSFPLIKIKSWEDHEEELRVTQEGFKASVSRIQTYIPILYSLHDSIFLAAS